LIDFGKEEEVDTRALLFELLDFIDDVVDELGSRSIIEKVPELMQKGTGADRQMAVFNQEKNMAQVVDYIGSQFLEGI
jgi:carboxylate-amine ligase